jgi:hypothetical protein
VATDPIRRSAALAATLAAVPVAIAVLLISAFAFGGLGGGRPAPEATGPVTMAERTIADDAVEPCQQVIAHLPDAVAGHTRRPVTTGAEQNAAYGEPPITVECGTALPPVGNIDEVYNLSGVCWFPVTGDGSTAWTTVDRAVPVTVTVPGAADGSGQFVQPFSNPVGSNDALREADQIPTGCSAEPTITAS